MTRDDPILGTEKRCPRCGEWWPLDDEFFYRATPCHRLRGARWQAYCRACWAERSAERYRARKVVAA